MDKDTFLAEIQKLKAEVSWLQVSKDIGRHYNTVRNYIDGAGENVAIMEEILTAAKSQIKSKAKQLQELVK